LKSHRDSRGLLDALQALASGIVLARLARGRRRRPPLAVPPTPPAGTISAVVPARNETARIGPCVTALLADSHLAEVVVVDDGSTDGTAQLARRLGARVVTAGERPAGWVGKPWALQRGLEEARGDVVVSLDADTRPRPGLTLALAAALEEADFVTVGARFICGTAGERFLHPALLATLVYRFGPPDADRPASPARLVANGQCTAVRRRDLLAAGGYEHAAGHMTDDAAQARALARLGWRVAFRDGGGLLAVDMHDSGRETWREWGRSIALGDVTSRPALAADLAVTWLVLALPPLRLAVRRAGRLDAALLALRLLMGAALARSYVRRGPAYWLSPLADPLAVARLTISALRPPRSWRGRTYGAGAQTAARSAP
jgi:dolichol-phosphate mannosyltransferase